MDPNEALEAARDEAKRIGELLDAEGMRERFRDLPPDVAEALNEANDLVEHFAALDQWLSQGGFLPAAWADQRAKG